MKKLLTYLLLLVSVGVFGQSESHVMTNYDTVIAYTGFASSGQNWQVAIYRPLNYFVSGSADTASRPLIITMQGEGEVGTSFINHYGPHYWLAHGWDGGVQLGNGTHYPIYITIQPQGANVRPYNTTPLIRQLIAEFHPSSVHFGGLSMGAQCLGWALIDSTLQGLNYLMAHVKSFVSLEGESPNSYTPGFTSTFPNDLGAWARVNGGRFLGLEGTADTRQLWLTSEAMNDSFPNSAYFSYQDFGGGGHGSSGIGNDGTSIDVWNYFYDRRTVDLTSTNQWINWVDNAGVHPHTLDHYTGPQESIMQWMLRNGDTTLVVPGCNPTVTIPTPGTIQLPTNTVSVTGTVTTFCGDIITNYSWTQVSGPSTATISNPTGATSNFNNLIAGTYVFRLTVTDNTSLQGTNTVTVTVLSAPITTVKTKVGMGEYQTFFTTSNNNIVAVGGNLSTQGVGGSGTAGLALPVVTSPSNLQFASIYGGLHGGAAIDINGFVWTWGDNAQYQYGTGTNTPNSIGNQITVDSSGNTFNNLVQLSAFFSGNNNNGWYGIKGDGTLWVWGTPLNGMKGDGTDNNHADSNCSRPVQIIIPGGRLAKKVQAGISLTVLCTDGTVWTCGGGSGGVAGSAANLGRAITGNNYTTLVQLTSLSNIVDITAGSEYNYALGAGGVNLYGWGITSTCMGLPGSGRGSAIATPTLLSNIIAGLPAPISSMAINQSATYAVLTNGMLYDWGDNAQGGIGNGLELDYTHTTNPYSWPFTPGLLLVQLPYRVTNRSDFVAVFATPNFGFNACGETADGTLYFWGRNKASVMPNGQANCSANQAANFPNALDVLNPTPMNPFTLTTVSKITCPICAINASTTSCGDVGCAVGTGVTTVRTNGTVNTTSSVAAIDASTTTSGNVILSYAWAKLAGSPAGGDIDVVGSTTTTVRNLQTGTYTYQVTVKDNSFNSTTGIVTINVGASFNGLIKHRGKNIFYQ